MSISPARRDDWIPIAAVLMLGSIAFARLMFPGRDLLFDRAFGVREHRQDTRGEDHGGEYDEDRRAGRRQKRTDRRDRGARIGHHARAEAAHENFPQ